MNARMTVRSPRSVVRKFTWTPGNLTDLKPETLFRSFFIQRERVAMRESIATTTHDESHCSSAMSTRDHC